ncbi:hypothetical protein ACQHIV_25520 [Kribbella sp. GL6]|uniref:hypothetical protein n=1 Tax=Kribbella sp. GL6 TaxID=3419765 RepID=UPI003CFF2FB1
MADDQQDWRVQLWLGDHLIEEHVAPAALAAQYANVIQLRIRGLRGRRLRCEPIPEQSPQLSSDLSSALADGHKHIMRKGS